MDKRAATLKHLDSTIAVLKQFTADVAKAASEAIKSLTASDVGALTEIKIGTVTTGAAGSKASASATTSGTVSTLNLTIPKGDKGDTGPTGATGAQGPKGDTGAAGAAGAKGATGATGTRGSRWNTGTAITGTSTTATVFSGSGITDALVNDMYLNTSTGAVYRCTTAGAAAVAKWVYVGSIKGATGAIGAQGAKGDTGATGPQGPTGATGAKGATGATGAKGDKGDSGVHYGTCSTAAATAAKTVALTGFALATGAAVIVRFTVTNTAANPTLNVNSTGAKAIRYRNEAIAAGYLAANRTYEFVYDGTYWQLVGDLDTDTSHVTTGTVSVPATGWDSDSTAIFPKYYDLSISGILATDRVDLIVAIASLDTALKCGLCGITEASAGKVRIRSRTVPTAAISLQYWVMKK